MCASTCTCYFTAETVIRNNSDSEMFLVRIIANIWQVINQENWHRPVGFSKAFWASWGKLRFIHCLSCFFLYNLCLLYSCSALLCWIIPRVLHLDWVTPTTKLSTDITDHLCISAWWHIWDSVCFTHPADLCSQPSLHCLSAFCEASLTVTKSLGYIMGPLGFFFKQREFCL